jgi:hypothetical protein
MAGQVTGRFITRPEPGTTRATWQRGPLLGIVKLKLATTRPLAVTVASFKFKRHPGPPHERRVLRATFRWLLPVAAMIVAQWYSGMRGRCLVLPHAPVGASHGSLARGPGSFYCAVESEPVARPVDCRRPAFGFGRARLSARQLECDRESIYRRSPFHKRVSWACKISTRKEEKEETSMDLRGRRRGAFHRGCAGG